MADQFLTFEIHLQDAALVAQLQGAPPGATSLQLGSAAKAIVRAPFNPSPAPLGSGAAVEFGTAGTPVLPMVGPIDANPLDAVTHKPVPYMRSEYFTSRNNFPRDVSTFTRKSGGWFGISALFGTTTRYYWRGVFVYDPPLVDTKPDGTPGTRESIQRRNWVDGFFVVPDVAQGFGANGALDDQHSREAGRTVDGAGIAIRGVSASGTRTHKLVDYGGAGGGVNSTQQKSWERLYIRLRRTPTNQVSFWYAHASGTGTWGVQVAVTPSGQLAILAIDAAGVATLMGTTTPLVLNQLYKFDIILDLSGLATGQIVLYLNGSQAISVNFGGGAGNWGGWGNRNHDSTELGLQVNDTQIELDVAFWMNATKPVTYDGIDWVNGSRAVWVKGTGFGADNTAGWTGDFRNLAAAPTQQNITGNILTSTTANAVLDLATDAAQSVDAVPGAIAVASAMIQFFGFRGTNPGALGYRIGVQAAVDGAALTAQGVAGTSNGLWNTFMYRVAGGATGVPFTPLRLRYTKGNDGVACGVVHLSATVELIGTFGNEDFVPGLAPALIYPLPYLGAHNAPYPRTAWARQATPSTAPLAIVGGTYVGNGTGQDLAFRVPVHFLWTRRLSTTPKGARWWSALLGAHRGTERATASTLAPDFLMDPSFSVVTTPQVPTGAGALPDRSADVATVIGQNPTLLDGTDANRAQLLQALVRFLNLTYAGDGFNWGVLTKNDRTPPVVPSDILVWKPTNELIDVFSGVVPTGATWSNLGVNANAAWVWTAVPAEGQQEQQTIVRITGADPESNQAGQTYAYVALCDPASRNVLSVPIALHPTGIALPTTRPLLATKWLPTAAFMQDDKAGVNNAGLDTTSTLQFKGPGNAAAATTLATTGGQQTPALTFQLGSLILDTAAFVGAVGSRLALALFRGDDGTNDPGKARVLATGSYVGNGLGSRGIAVAPSAGRYPLFVYVQPSNAGAHYKDHQHTGGNDSDLAGAQVATGIISGGLDQFTVGATLNTNAITYSWLVIWGGTTAGGDGFSNPGEFIPVDPSIPPDNGEPIGLPPETPVEPTTGTGTGTPTAGDTPGLPGGGGDDMDTDLATACLPFTTRIVNIALSRIGVTKTVGNLAANAPAWSALTNYVPGDRAFSGATNYAAILPSLNQVPPNPTYWADLGPTDASQEADLARLHWAKDVEAVLRDFAWPFATRYANLALLGGSSAAPVNGDWTFSYRRPSDCVFERRIAVARAGAVNPTPPPFQLSFDDTGGRIFTNEAAAQLEYTARPSCSAGDGDPLFRDALAWKLAGSFAGPLTRIDAVEDACSKRYDAAIAKAVAVLRPGNPGVRTDVDPSLLDQAAGCQAANLALVNRALIRIGARTVANLATEQSREAESARVLFEDELRSVLRDHPWAFCTKYESALVLVAGSPTVPANADWIYAYRYPADCVLVRRIVQGTNGLAIIANDPTTVQVRGPRGYDRQPNQFRVGQDASGDLIYTDLVAPTIEYTARIGCVVGRADPLFRDAFAWRLAASLAPSVAQVDPEAIEQQGRGPQERPRERKATEGQMRAAVAKYAQAMYQRVLEQARIADMREQQQDPNQGDADWIAGRN